MKRYPRALGRTRSPHGRKRRPVERLAFTAAQQLRKALGHPATANEHARGCGTVCLTGHPVIEHLWLLCTEEHPEKVLSDIKNDTADMKSGELPIENGPPLNVPWLPVILYRSGQVTISALTPLWVLDELRWISQRETGDSRSLLDTMLSRLNPGDVLVVVRPAELVTIVKAAVINTTTPDPATRHLVDRPFIDTLLYDDSL